MPKNKKHAIMSNMRVPKRKPGKFSQLKPDPLMTKDKFNELEQKLKKLKNVSHPQAVEEVKRLAELGDFSENVEYQLAKGRLRGINNAILKIEYQLNNTVQIGHTVTIESDKKQSTYLLLGSSETNPQKGIISHNSPIGAALIGHSVGDTIQAKLANKLVEYKITKIK